MHEEFAIPPPQECQSHEDGYVYHPYILYQRPDAPVAGSSRGISSQRDNVVPMSEIEELAEKINNLEQERAQLRLEIIRVNQACCAKEEEEQHETEIDAQVEEAARTDPAVQAILYPDNLQAGPYLSTAGNMEASTSGGLEQTAQETPTGIVFEETSNPKASADCKKEQEEDEFEAQIEEPRLTLK